MDSIKKFFDKKKRDAKFKVAGEGKKLSSARSQQSSRSRTPSHQPQQRHVPTAEAQRAAAAALARFDNTPTKTVDWSLQAIKAQAKREMEAEKKLQEMSLEDEKGNVLGPPVEQTFEAAPMLAVQGVYFSCPLIGPEVDTYEVIKSRIRDLLLSQLGEDKDVSSCLLIHTCNKNKEKVSLCVETLCKYIENLVSNPSEPKFRKIRQSNKVYKEKVCGLEGSREFLECGGFEEQQLAFNDGHESFWVIPDETPVDVERLESLRDTLVSAEPLRPQLDRSMRVLMPTEAAEKTDLPREFFALSIDEMKKEQQLRSNAVERSQMMMTKAMRDKMEVKEMRKYRFTLIRIRFPDGIFLQGTFTIHEKLSRIYAFVRENLENDWRPFFLSISGGGRVSEDPDDSLLELHLVPAVVFNFEWDASVQDPNLDDKTCLKEEVLMLLQHQD